MKLDLADRNNPSAPYPLYDVGNSGPTESLEFIAIIEQKLGKKARMNLLPMGSRRDKLEHHQPLDRLVP